MAVQKLDIDKYVVRPFETGDMTPVPEGWTAGPPGFVGVASGKAGTSWWYKLLSAHPSVKRNRLKRKELFYFYHFGYDGLDPSAVKTYRQAFAAPPGGISGEWSPGYLNFPMAVDYIAETVPETKILAIVRNPVDRVLSAQNQKLSKQAGLLGIEDRGDRAYIYKTFSVFQVAIYNSFLYEPFKRLLNVFDRSRVLVLQYEKCKADPAAEIKKTYRFLGIDDGFVPPNLTREVNKKPYLVPPLGPGARARLAAFFRDDVAGFGKLFPEIDLSLWGTDFPAHG